MKNLYITLFAFFISFSAFGQAGVISGSPYVCVGASITLSDTPAGGSWSSSNVVVATVGSTSGIVTGNFAGTDVITYTAPGGSTAILVVTVNSLMLSPLNDGPACVGGTVNLTAGASGTASGINYNWVGPAGFSSSVSTPVLSSVTAIMGGTYTVTATSASAGCSATSTTNVTIQVMGVSPATTGSCPGQTMILLSNPFGTASITSYTWSGPLSWNSSLANPVLGSASSALDGVYTLTATGTGSGCTATGTTTVTFTTLNIAPTSNSPLCAGDTLFLYANESGAASPVTYTWSGPLGFTSTVMNTIQYGIPVDDLAGIWTLYATGSGCSDTTTITVIVGTASISGWPVVCQGLTVSLSDPTSGGTWSSSDPSLASVDPATGIVTGVSPGTGTISYTAPGGCANTVPFSITAGAGTVTGPSLICSTSSATYSDATAGGAWSVGFAAIATISSGGILTPVSTGTTTVVYTLPGGCLSSMVVTIDPTPTPMTIAPNPVCIGLTATLSDAASGGTWSTSAPAIAYVDGLGGLVAVSVGTTNVSYTLSTGCMTTSVVTVNAGVAAIGGSTSVCVGGTATLTDAVSGGTWSSPSITATVDIGGVVTGVSPGTATISYTIPSGCAAITIVTVTPGVAAITGPSSICLGMTATLSDATGGGSWSSYDVAVAPVGSASGIVTGVSLGTTIITYSIPGGCYSTAAVTIEPLPSVISGPTSVCAAGTITLTDGTAGGTWISSTPGIASIDPATGVLTGVSPGTTTISYQLATTCATSLVVTVEPTPAAPVISGTSLYCPCVTFVPLTIVPSTGILWYAAATGGTGTATAPVINTCISGTTTNWASQTASGCESSRASFTVTVDVTPAITASGTSNCGGTFSLTSSGAGTGGTYVWSPSTGLSCPTCASATATVSSTSTYTVTGTDAGGCAGTNTVTLAADRISGYLSLTTTATDTLKVWLIQFNTTDSSIIGQDSTFSCMDSGTPYYEFDSKPAGNYMVKAKLLSSVPGTSGYVPTYGLSSSVWDSAATFTHAASATDTQHINMIYGTVPPGPGFIGGLISSGAGRGTAMGAPAVGMLVYLKNAATNAILTYTYTDTSGAYAFSGLGNGSYTIYPVDYQYHTTPWIDLTLTTSSDSVAGISFYEHTGNNTITPYPTPVPVCCGGPITVKMGMYPNPAGNELNIYWADEPTGAVDVTITDLAGREVYKAALNMGSHSGTAQVDLSSIGNGAYLISVKSNHISYANTLMIQH